VCYGIGPETEQCARDVLSTVDIGPETEQYAMVLVLRLNSVLEMCC